MCRGARRCALPHPQPLSHRVGEGCSDARWCALLIPIARSESINSPPPSGSPRFARGTEKRARSVPPACRGNLKELIRVHRLSSLCAGFARFFALTPSPSPPAGARGVGAHGSAPSCAFPLSRKAGEGDKGVRAKRRACPFTPARRKSPLPQRFCTEPMYPYQTLRRGVFTLTCFCELWLRDWYKRVGFLQACLFAELPSRASLPPCERDARAPSTRDAGNAGVPPAMPTAREKTYPFNTNRGDTVYKNKRN